MLHTRSLLILFVVGLIAAPGCSGSASVSQDNPDRKTGHGAPANAQPDLKTGHGVSAQPDHKTGHGAPVDAQPDLKTGHGITPRPDHKTGHGVAPPQDRKTGHGSSADVQPDRKTGPGVAPDAQPDRKTGTAAGELKASKNTQDGKNTMIEVLQPGEEQPRKYFVNYDPNRKAPIPEVLAAVRAAKVGDRVRFDWVQTGHGPAITKFEIVK